jgi:hypothetical protein
VVDPAQALLQAITAFYESAAAAADDGTGPMLAEVRAALAAATPLPLAPRTIPAAALLDSALSPKGLEAAIARASHLFRWRQNPNYTAAAMGAAFMAGYGYVEFAGPKEALFHAPGVRVGFLVLGPGVHYPPHAHPAEEIYHPLTDGGLWRRGGEAWRTAPAGHAIHHPPMIAHETKAGESTLLALYAWRGDTMTEATLTA